MEEKKSHISTVEPEEKIFDAFSANVFESNGQKELAKDVLFSKQRILQKLKKPVDEMQKSAKTFLEEHKNYDDTELLSKEEEPTTKPDLTNNTILEKPNFDYIKTPETNIEFKTKQKKQKGFRLRLLTAVYAIVFALSAGWVIYNAVEITKTNYQIVQYLVKIDQLDNASKAESGDETIITSLVEVEARELTNPTEIQIQTNFFDKLCNFFSRIFGG